MELAELQLDIAPLRNFQCVVAGGGHIGKESAHFGGRLQIIIIARKFHAVFIANLLARLQTKQQVMKLGVLAIDVMRIVCGDKRQVKLGGKIFQRVTNFKLIFQPVILYLQKKIIAPENFCILGDKIPCTRQIFGKNGAGNFA